MYQPLPSADAFSFDSPFDGRSKEGQLGNDLKRPKISFRSHSLNVILLVSLLLNALLGTALFIYSKGNSASPEHSKFGKNRVCDLYPHRAHMRYSKIS